MQIESGRFQGAVIAEPADVPVFLAAGLQAEGEFHCAECGYGVIVRTELPQCPMCRGLAWEGPADGPFAPLSA
jgi:rubrerythrin